MNKIIKITFTIVALIAAGITTQSCSFNTKKTSGIEGKEHTSKYVCPMHCKGSGSDSAGSCPVCKMDYEKNSNSNHKH